MGHETRILTRDEAVMGCW